MKLSVCRLSLTVIYTKKVAALLRSALCNYVLAV